MSIDYTKVVPYHNKILRSYFERLSFEEKTHKYTVEGVDKPIKSVSSLVKYFYDEFKTQMIAKKYATKRGFTEKQVLDAWSGEGLISTDRGTAVHLVGENYAKWKYFKEGEEPNIICKKSLGAVQFLNDLPDHLIVVALELQMYDEENWFCGTCDGVILDTRDNGLYIYDYKTNAEIKQKGKAKLKIIDKSFELTQDNYGKYCCQFSFYQILLEQTGYKVKDRILVWLSPNEETGKLYTTYRTPDLTQPLIQFLESKAHLG